MAIGDSAPGQVVGRKLQRDTVAVHDLDPITPESPGHGRQDRLAGVQFNREHPGLELLDHFPQHFN